MHPTPDQLKAAEKITDERGCCGGDYCTIDHDKELIVLISTLLSDREAKARREGAEKIVEAVKNAKHDEGDGGWCDTGADMDWACRSYCLNLAVAEAEKTLAELK